MSFPNPQDWNLVVAKQNEAGEPDFFSGAKPEAVDFQPGVVEGTWYWRVDTGHTKDTPGAVSKIMDHASSNGSTFGVVRFPANSAGKLVVAATERGPETGRGGDPAMHATGTIDYNAVLSGTLDLELPGAKVHTLVPGDLLVVASPTPGRTATTSTAPSLL
jgi:hypothetical protein